VNTCAPGGYVVPVPQVIFKRGTFEVIWGVFNNALQLTIHCLLKNWMHSFEVSLGYEGVDRRNVENVGRSTLSYPNKTSKECIQFL
jgi:hypothetical protein